MDPFPFAEQRQELSRLSLSPNEETELTLDLATLLQQLPDQQRQMGIPGRTQAG